MNVTDRPVIILVRPQLAENIGMCARAMANFGLSEMRLGERTDALIVIHQGAIFYERYARGWGATNPHFGPIVSADDKVFDKTFETNARGYFSLARETAKPFWRV
mgnify:CR=1 FL=1